MNRVRTILYTAIIGPAAVLWLFVSAFCAVPVLGILPGKGGRYFRRFMFVQSKGILFFMRLISRSWSVHAAARPAKPCILAANHMSVLDVYCFAALGFKNVVFVAKGWPFRMPFFRFFMNGARYINAQELSAPDLLLCCKAALEAGCDVVFFPQGTRRSPGARFKGGAFWLARQTGAPVVPVALGGTGTMIPPGTFSLHPADVRLESLPALYAKDFTGPSGHLEMAHETRKRIFEVLSKGDNQ